MRRLSLQRLTLNRRSRSGDRCGIPECAGKLEVYSTRVKLNEDVRVQYLRCSRCSWKPSDNKLIIPLDFAPVRPFPEARKKNSDVGATGSTDLDRD